MVITKQIKRTRLRLVSYIQVLSRAAYLPIRYSAIIIQSNMNFSINDKLQDLENGSTTTDDLQLIVKYYQNLYKDNGKLIDDLIVLDSFRELKRRLESSVFSTKGESYNPDFRKYCISSEYKNTKLFISSLKKIFDIAKKGGRDVTSPSFFGQPDPGFTVPLETIVHIVVRHNSTINKFINPDSRQEGYTPTPFSSGVFADVMLKLLMALNVIEDSDWQQASSGKNLICHFKLAEQEYTIIRKGHSKEIKSFYPRNDGHNATYIELERVSDEMRCIKK